MPFDAKPFVTLQKLIASNRIEVIKTSMNHCRVKEESEVCREGQKRRERDTEGGSVKEDER